jgi:hypothetical protein
MPYIGTSPSNGVRRVHTYTATASQTTFSGASSEGVTLSYADTNYIDVFQNGVLLGSADYTSTSGTSVVLAQGASVDDLIVIVVYDVFSVADTVSKTSGGTFDGIITTEPVLAKLVMTSDQTNLTDEAYNKLKLDSAVIDTKSGFNNGNDTYVIPVAGYYRIYAQAHIGVIGETGSTRDTALVITRTRSSTETQLAFSHHRHHNGSDTDTSDLTEQVYTIDQCEVSDIITVYTYLNSDTDTAYDVFADVDAGNDLSHMNTGLVGTGGGEDTSTFVIVERIV